MEAAQPLRHNGKIIGYFYREVFITRTEGYGTVIWSWTIDRYDGMTIELSENRITLAKRHIDGILDSAAGRTTGGKLIIVSVSDGRIVTSLMNPDWRHPGARLVTTEA